MRKVKTVLALGLAAALLGGCAAYPYDESYYSYNDPYYRSYDGYYYGPRYYSSPGYYYGPSYYGPSVGLGFSWSSRSHRYR